MKEATKKKNLKWMTKVFAGVLAGAMMVGTWVPVTAHRGAVAYTLRLQDNVTPDETKDDAVTPDETKDDVLTPDEVMEDNALDRTDALALAVNEMFFPSLLLPLVPENYQDFDFVPLYDDDHNIVARYIRFSGGAHIIINNNKENPFIAESGVYGLYDVDAVIDGDSGMEIIYDGIGAMRFRDFEDGQDPGMRPEVTYHTSFPNADKPDPEMIEKLAYCRETVLNEDGMISNDWILNMQVEFFVRRLYVRCLQRLPDQSGFDAWVAALKNGVSAGKVAKGFFFSQEYLSHNPMEGLYVLNLYMTLFDRRGEEEEVNRWTSAMMYGATKEQVFRGFIKSKEFGLVCEDLGIVK